MKVILVGAGWLARQLWQPLQQAGYEVFLTSRTRATAAEFGQHGLVLPLNGSELNDVDILQTFAGAVVICLVPASRKQPELYLSALKALARLMQKAASQACIHISSSGIYQGLNGVLDEHTPLDIIDPRVELLYQGELLLQNQLAVCTLRLAGLMGPGRHPGRFLAGKAVADPTGAVNMLHSADACAFILKVLQSQLWPQLYNLSSPAYCSRQMFYQNACAALGLAEPEFAEQRGEGRRVDATKAQLVPGFAFRYHSALDALVDC